MNPIVRTITLISLAALPMAAQADPEPFESQALLEQSPCGPREGRPGDREERFAKTLDLSEEQRARIKAIHDKYRDGLRAKREAAQEASRAFHKAASNPDTPADQLRKLHQTMSDSRFEALLAARTQRNEVRSVLTPAQRERAAYMAGRMQGRMQGRMMGRPGPRPERPLPR